MEQKTEASQAVDELSPTIVDEDGLPMAIAGVLRSKGDIVSLATLYMLIDAWGEKQRNHVRAALKAQPAPTEAAQGEDSARLDAAHARLLAAVKVYSNGYMQDEAADEEDCVCGAEQHAEAKEVFAAIVEVERASAETGGVKS